MYICYFYDKYGTLLAQIDQLQELDIIQKLNAVGTGTFTVKTEQLKALESLGSLSDSAYKLVNISKQYEDGTELQAFTGWLVWYDGDFDFKRVATKSLLHLLERREIETELTFEAETFISEVLHTVVNHINSVYDTNITVNCTTSETVLEKKYSFGQNVLAILNDLAGSTMFYDLVPNRELQVDDSTPFNFVLNFGENIGVDRTNEVLFEDDIVNPAGKNISVKGTLDFTKLANAVKAKNGNFNSTQVNTADIEARGIRLDATITPQGDLDNEATKELATRLNPAVKLDVTPDEIGDAFFTYSIGDIVSVYIYHGDPLLDFDGVMKIIEKKLDAGDDEKNTMKLWIIADDGDDDPVTVEKKTRERVKRLELQTL